jgi:GntR family transcriptional regulator/MocR family aminotransferase
MRTRDLALNIHDSSGATLVERIARALEKAIRDGRLRAGDGLPGSRSLAEALGVGRNTVLAAIDLLIAEGWLVTEPWRGTFVAPSAPVDAAPAHPTAPAGLGFELPSARSHLSTGLAGLLDLADGWADSSLAPKEELGKAYQRALRLHGDRLLTAGDLHGNPLLRESLAAWVSERHGVAVGPERILVTRGGRSGVRLIAEALLKPGDRVGVEEPGNRALWEILRRHREVELCPLKVDAQGVLPESLEEALRGGPLRLMVLTPRCQFPTGAVLARDRAQRVLELAAAHRIAIFEDDSDAEFQYREPRNLPLLAQDGTGQVIFGVSLARLMAPGIRMGFLVVPAALGAHLARLRPGLETQGDRVAEWAFADLVRDGDFGRHLRRARKAFQARRDHLGAELHRELSGRLVFRMPEAGLALWLEAGGGVDLAGWIARAKGEGLLLAPPSRFHLDQASPCTRMGFAQVDEAGLTEAVARLKRAMDPGA